MQQYDLNYITCLIPAVRPHEYGAICRYYAKLPRQTQIEAHRLHTSIMRTRSHDRQEGKQPEFIYATFIQAVAQIRSLERANDNRQLLSEPDAARVVEIRGARIDARKRGKGSPVKDKIEKRYLQMIQQMRAEGRSWRDISFYLQKYHRQKLSFSYLRRVFLENVQE